MNAIRSFLVDSLDTDVGPLTLVCDEGGALCSVEFEAKAERRERFLAHHHGDGVTLVATRDPFQLTTALRRYFDGELGAITPLRVATVGTVFQRAVWAALREIPAGETESYGGLAARIGRPRAVRAVGLANGSNPVGVVVPCHRVIGANGTLTGYGGGIERKKFLLEHEARNVGGGQRVMPFRLDGVRVLPQ